MPVENGDRVRVDKLEVEVSAVKTELSTLSGKVEGHIEQGVRDKREAKADNERRHAEVLDGLGTLGTGIAENKTELDFIKRLDTDRRERAKNGLTSKEFPANPKAAQATKVAVGTGAAGGIVAILYIIIEIIKYLNATP